MSEHKVQLCVDDQPCPYCDGRRTVATLRTGGDLDAADREVLKRHNGHIKMALVSKLRTAVEMEPKFTLEIKLILSRILTKLK